MTRRWLLGVLAALVSAPRALSEGLGSGNLRTRDTPSGSRHGLDVIRANSRYGKHLRAPHRYPVAPLTYKEWQEAMKTYRPGVGPPCCACEHPGEG